MPKPIAPAQSRAGFTLVELVMAMAVFSFMLLIIVQGMINIVRMHNQAIASNVAQDNARGIMDELVRAVRNSNGVDWSKTSNDLVTGDTKLCLDIANAAQRYYWVTTVSGVLVLYRNDSGCTTAVPPTAIAVSNAVVNVSDFQVKQTTTTPFNRQEVHISLTVASSNGTTTGSHATTACQANNSAREFCSVVTLTSGAVPR